MTNKWKQLDSSNMLKVIFWLFTVVFLVAAVVSPDRAEMISGLKTIYTTPAQVTKDYFEVGSVSAAFRYFSPPVFAYTGNRILPSL